MFNKNIFLMQQQIKKTINSSYKSLLQLQYQLNDGKK
jgi:hypothetical protein